VRIVTLSLSFLVCDVGVMCVVSLAIGLALVVVCVAVYVIDLTLARVLQMNAFVACHTQGMLFVTAGCTNLVRPSPPPLPSPLHAAERCRFDCPFAVAFRQPSWAARLWNASNLRRLRHFNGVCALLRLYHACTRVALWVLGFCVLRLVRIGGRRQVRVAL